MLRKMRVAALVTGAAVIFAGSTSALAGSAKNNPGGEPVGSGKRHPQKGPPHAPTTAGDRLGEALDMRVGFTASERDVIVGYFRTHPAHVKPLPPGIAKNLGRGKPLPPGIAKRYLPTDLLGLLPQRAGYEPWLVGNDVLLLETATGIVVDLIVDILWD